MPSHPPAPHNRGSHIVSAVPLALKTRQRAAPAPKHTGSRAIPDTTAVASTTDQPDGPGQRRSAKEAELSSDEDVVCTAPASQVQ